jgi:aerobic C4-dicarboxylate transport protein
MIGLVLLLGVDRFLNEARAVTNLIGNGIGTIAIAKWDGSFDKAKAAQEIAAMNARSGKRVAPAAPGAETLTPARVRTSQR